MSIIIKEDLEDWIKPCKDWEDGPLKGGTVSNYLLHDTQIQYRPGLLKTYKSFVIKINKPADFKNINPIHIVLNDSYETCFFFSLNIIRDGSSFSKLSEIRFLELQREQELEQNVLSGLKTYVTHVEDLRIGDIVTYDFMIESKNKIYEKNFTYFYQFGFTVPIKQIQFSLDYQNGGKVCRTIQRMTGREDVRVEILNGEPWIWKIHNQPAILPEVNIPTWFEPFPYFIFSDHEDWNELKEDLLDYYNCDSDYETLQKKINEMGLLPGQPESIEKIVSYVQKEIHYQSISLDEHSYLPHRPGEVLAKKFGDCKDKSLLLKCFLKALNVTSTVVLVHSYLREQVVNRLISLSNFNHAILSFDWEGQKYFLDPTDAYDCFSLSNPAERNWGYGLFLDTQIALHPIQHRNGIYKRLVKETHTVAGPVTIIQLEDRYDFLAFSEAYGTYVDQNLEDTKKNYHNYFARRYPNLEVFGPEDAGYTVDFATRNVTFRCSFRVPDYWQKQEDDKPPIAFFHPDQFLGIFPVFNDSLRLFPHVFPHRIDFEYTFAVTIDYDENFGSLDSDFSSICFEAKIRTKQTTPKSYLYTIDFKSKKNMITPEEWPSEKKAINSFLNTCSFHIMQISKRKKPLKILKKIGNFFVRLFTGPARNILIIVFVVAAFRILGVFLR